LTATQSRVTINVKKMEKNKQKVGRFHRIIIINYVRNPFLENEKSVKYNQMQARRRTSIRYIIMELIDR